MSDHPFGQGRRRELVRRRGGLHRDRDAGGRCRQDHLSRRIFRARLGRYGGIYILTYASKKVATVRQGMDAVTWG
jgi:hypothetical protein